VKELTNATFGHKMLKFTGKQQYTPFGQPVCFCKINGYIKPIIKVAIPFSYSLKQINLRIILLI
jgi:hypothetical protein